MRELKFRVYSTVTGSFDFISMTDLLISDNSKISKKMVNDDLTVDQFTCLQDKNGVDIYEGDIVDGVTYKDYSIHIGRVLYDYNGYMISTGEKSLTLCLTEKLTVIGNIHQNPELLTC